MNLGLGLELVPQLEQELKLVPSLTLEQHLEKEEIIHRVIEWTEENKAWRNFRKDGFNFSYGSVPYEVAQPISDELGYAFAHCFYDQFEALIKGKKIALARGDWTLFVVNDKVPKEFVDFAAIHERGEELSLGNHNFASKLEFALANKRGKLNEYLTFISKMYPDKNIDVFRELEQDSGISNVPQELLDHLGNQGLRNEKELRLAEELIKKYPIPSEVFDLFTLFLLRTSIC
tara:strand:+ start:18630 stop:19325 length:696 start_codon:yes stop_codon:yes gene_type:complete